MSWVIFAFGLVLAGGLAILSLALIARQESANRLPKSEGVYRLALDAAGDAIVVANRHGKIEVANRRAERMFGYPHGGMDGLEIDALIPDRFRARHDALYSVWFEAPHARPLGHGSDVLYARRHDGSEFRCQIGLAPAGEEEDPRAVAVIKEIT